MLLSDFDYDLPKELIAQEPLDQRDRSRLLVLNRMNGKIEHSVFSDLLQYLKADDVLVFNDTKVIKARLKAKRETGGRVEVFVVRHLSEDQWLVMLNPAKRIKNGEKLFIQNDFYLEVLKKHYDSQGHLVRFHYRGNFFDNLDNYGLIPLPPYIQKSREETANNWANRYQTIFAEKPGALAAPTASLHFSQDLKQQLVKKGLQFEFLTLHVGLGTFKPMTTENIDDHKMHSEWMDVSSEAARRLSQAKKARRRIIAVGTTVVRTLESIYKDSVFHPGKDFTDIFIRPGYAFKAVDAMITNFHLPKSTLMLLVSAFAGKTQIDQAYQEAILRKYRFFSFGDAMLIL